MLLDRLVNRVKIAWWEATKRACAAAISKTKESERSVGASVRISRVSGGMCVCRFIGIHMKKTKLGGLSGERNKMGSGVGGTHDE